MNLRKFRYFLTFLAVIPVFTGFIAATDLTAQNRPLVFAGNDKFAPYSFLSDGQPEGYCVDLIKILSATINREISIKLIPWEECVSELNEGDVDGLIGISIYKDHENHIAYSEPIEKIEFAIFVEATNSYVNSVKSLEGTVVSIPKESLIANELRKNKRIKLLETDTVMDALHKLKNREVTAVIAEKNVAVYYIQQNNIEGLKIVGAPVGQVYDYALAVRKDDPELINDINRGIGILKENHTLSKLQRKWFGIHLIVEPFPWKMVFLATSGITGLILLLAGILWVISLNTTVKMKTQQIQLMSQKIIEKDKLAVLGKLAGQIAHELRTPLSIIKNSVFLLRKEGRKNQELFEKRLRVLDEKIKLSSNILESILSYSRVKAEAATIVSVKECIEEVLNDMGIPEGIEKNITFEKEAALLVFMDFHQLYSILRNVILNAVQAMSETGTLTIKAFPSDNNMIVNIRICDTGPGIMENARNKIFNLFYSTKITGTGLGLPISKSIIEANNGQLDLEESSEKGSCFIITLPSSKSPRK